MRIALLGVTAALAAVLAGASPAPAGPPPVVARTVYVVRPDPRLCPSPLCGGYWVAKVNHARTRCHDGHFRPRCYIATVLSERTREPLTTGLPADGLVRAAMGSTTTGGFGELGALTVAEIWRPIGKAEPRGDYFRVRDTGVRCVRAPCFSIRVARLERGSSFLVSGLELVAVGATERDYVAAQRALTLLVFGTVERTADGGRTLGASRFYLRDATPRA